MKLRLGAAALTGVQVGAALVASQAVVADVGAGRLGFLRYAIALLFLLPFVRRRASPAISRRDLVPVALIGMGQFGVLILFLNVAVMHTSSARVALVFATLPLMTIALGWFLTRETPRTRDLAAIVLTLIGLATLLGADAVSGSLSGSDLTGLAMAAAATLTGAICSSLYRPYLQRYGVVKVSALALAASLLPLGVAGLLEPATRPLFDLGAHTWLLIAFVGLSSGVGYLLWLYALSSVNAGLVTAFLALSPITATGLSVMFLSQAMTPALIAAVVFVVAGLAVMALPARTRAPAPNP